MTRTLTMVPLLTCLVCAPVLAQPAPPSKPPSAPSPTRPLPVASSVRIALAIKAGTDVRTHQLVISDDGCGLVKERTNVYADEVRICSRRVANGVVIEIDGTTSIGPHEYRTRSEAVLARTGASLEIGRTSGVRYAVTTN